MKQLAPLAWAALLVLSGCNAGHDTTARTVLPAPSALPVAVAPTTAGEPPERAPAQIRVVADTTACLASLKTHARVPRARETVSIFRMFNAYPPRPGAVLDAENGDDVDLRQLRRVDILPACLPSLPFTFDLYDPTADGGMARRKALLTDLHPVDALRLNTGNFLVLYAHRAIETFDHGEDVVMVSAVMFNKAGRASSHVPQISLFVSYEGSLLMEDAQLDDEGLSITYAHFHPERQDRVGNVLEYTRAAGPELRRHYRLDNDGFQLNPGMGYKDPAENIAGYASLLTHH